MSHINGPDQGRVDTDLEFWIDSSSTYVGDDETGCQHCDVRDVVGSDDDAGLRRKLPVRQNGYVAGDVFWELGSQDAVCKDAPWASEHKILVMPRSFQHHRIQRWLKKHLVDQGYELSKNFQCPPSRCVHDRGPHSGDLHYINWISYRYTRHSGRGKEVMCRFCHGRNWVNTSVFFKHLFLAHGIMTQIRPGSLSGFTVETFKLTEWFTVNVQTVRSVEFTRNLMPFLEVYLVPVPRKSFSKVLSNGFRRTHVLCPNCSKWIRLGWCEYDEIIKQDCEDFDSFRNLNNENYARISYIQKRDRNSIEGLYENFFIHYIECDSARFQSRSLYVQVLDAS